MKKLLKIITAILLISSTVTATAAITTLEMVVPYAAGGTADRVARILQKWMPEQMQIDYKPGAGSAVGVAYVVRKKSPAFVIVSNGFIVNVLQNTANYSIADLQPVATIGFSQSALTTSTVHKINSVERLLLHKDNLFYGTSGIGSTSYINALILKQNTGLKMTHVPFKGEAESLTNVLGGNVDLMFSTVSTVQNQNVRILAVTGPRRHPQLPTVPTFAEVGVKGLDHNEFWLAILASPAADPMIITTIQQSIGRLSNNPEFLKELNDAGIDMNTERLFNTKQLINSDFVRLKKLIRSNQTPS